MFYLGSGPKRASSSNLIEAAADVDEIPIAKLELASGLLDIPAPKGSFWPRALRFTWVRCRLAAGSPNAACAVPYTDKKGKGKKGKKAQAEEEVEAKHFEVSREEEMPEGTLPAA